MRVVIAQPLQGYTRSPRVEARAANLAELLLDLDRRFPGIRFRILDEHGRIRPHMRIFVNRQRVADLEWALGEGDEVHILQALSGG